MLRGGLLMIDPSLTSAKSPKASSAISSPASEDGAVRSDLPESPTTPFCGQPLCPASRSALLAKGKAFPTTATSGQSSLIEFGDITLQSCLESRLQAQMAEIGSWEYSLTWSQQGIGWREPICALRGRGRQISVKGFTGVLGFPTPRANKHNHQSREDFTPNLAAVALKMAGYPTCTVTDSQEAGSSTLVSGQREWRNRNPGDTLVDSARKMSGWATLNAADSIGSHGGGQGSSLRTDAKEVSQSGESGQTERLGALNPELARFLMGYPIEWSNCADTAMQSIRTSRRSSSPRSSAPSKTKGGLKVE
jgi:hypothetical protein